MTRLLAIFLTVLVVGCAAGGAHISKSSLAGIKPGVTTKQEMIQAFGRPISHSYGTEGNLTMMWMDMIVAPFVGVTRSRQLSAIFDGENVLMKYTITGAE